MKRSRRPLQRLFSALAMLILASLACSNIPIKPQPTAVEPRRISLQTGASEPLTSATAGPDGGLLLVTAPGTAVDGFSIQVPADAYSQDVPFDISMQPILSHNLPAELEVITPLIHVDNGEVWAEDYLEVNLPLELAEDEFAMLFIYDQESGAIDALPLVTIDETHLTALTLHFSDLLGVKVNTFVLNNINIQTGFSQGVNNWQFTNYGSYISSKGHCAGQTLMAVDFFSRNPGVALYGRYDNYNNDLQLFGLTPKNWYDDRAGYRLCSMAQERMDWEGRSYLFWRKVQLKNDLIAFYSLSLAMYASGEPQLVGIFNSTGGHMIIAYEKRGNRFLVSDPNYPAANANRSVQFNRQKARFATYYSGPNADNLGTAYTVIRYINKYGFLSKAQLTYLWNAFNDGTIGMAEFPEVKLTYFHEVVGESYTDMVVDDKLLVVDDTRPDFYLDSSLPTMLLVYDQKNRQVAKSEGLDTIELNLSNPDGTPYLFSIFAKVDNRWMWIDGFWVNLVQSYGGSWHSRSACLESESDPYKWGITLTHEESGRIYGDLYFHNCPGGGAVYYALDGYLEAGKKGLQLDGFLIGGRGDLFEYVPESVVFTIKRNGAPSPNYAP